MANFPTSPSTGSIFSTGRNVYKYNGTAWETISSNISVGFPEMTGSFNDLSGSLPNISNVGAFVPSNITASVLQLDGAFSYDSSHTSIPTTGSGVKLRATTGHTEGLVLHLKMDGPNGGTSFTDISPSGHTVTVSGGAKTDNGASVFGTSSAYFDGTGDYLGTPASSDFNFGTDDFTIELWINPSHNSGYNDIMASKGYYSVANGGWAIEIYNGKLGFWTYNGTTSEQGQPSNASIAVGEWTHVAIAQSSGDTHVYINGTLDHIVSNQKSLPNGGVYGLDIGRVTAGALGIRYYTGYMDDIRIYKGVAKYTSAFTVQDATDRQDILLPLDAPTLTIENKYNNILKEYTINMTSDDTRMALTGSN